MVSGLKHLRIERRLRICDTIFYEKRKLMHPNAHANDIVLLSMSKFVLIINFNYF